MASTLYYTPTSKFGLFVENKVISSQAVRKRIEYEYRVGNKLIEICIFDGLMPTVV